MDQILSFGFGPGDSRMCDAILACDPNALHWDIAERDYDLDASGNLAAEYHVPLDRVLSLL